MKEIIRKKCTTLILLTSLICTSISCLNQSSPNNRTTETTATGNTKSSENQKNTMPQLKYKSMIRSIFEDSKGNFWFGSDQEGVCQYDGKSFTYFTTKDGLSDNQIRTIQEDPQGNIWLATGYGISKYDGQNFSTQTAKDYLIPHIIPENKWKKEATDLWFNGEVEGGIYRYGRQTLAVLEFPRLDPDHESFSISGTVTGICEGKNNMLWMANYGGVIGYDGQSFKFINKRDFAYHVRSILEDSKGRLWIGNNGIGVLLYDGNTTINFTEKKGLHNEDSQRANGTSPKGALNHVFAIAEDRDGNIWFGDRDDGAWRYDGQNLINYTMKDGLPSMFVRVIYKDRSNDLWFGMEGGNLCKFNGESFYEVY